jgi:arabinofuranosyltransferase
MLPSDFGVTTATPPSRLPSTLTRLARTIPFVVLTAWIVAVALHASVVVEGVRVFYLDDVQMVAMRYARNLAEGQGLVWNPGERVEGYSNPAWVLTMAAVHAAGAPDRTAALHVKAIAWALACAVLVLATRLRHQLRGPNDLADAALMLMLAVNADVVFWAANGFETPLLTVVFLWLTTRVLDESERGETRPGTMLAAGGLALVRSDAHLLIASIVGVAIVLSRDRSRTAKLALLACVLPAIHEAARLAYYREWLPNTYQLRMTGVPDLLPAGATYVKHFVRGRLFLVALALAACARPRDWRPRALAALCAAVGVHAITVGGDFLVPFRFIAPAVPIIAALAVVAAEDAFRYGDRLGRLALALVVVVGVISGGMVSRWPIEAMRSWRGKPWHGAAIGLLIARGAEPTATVAAAGGGALGYFSRRTVIDLTGRTDSRVARLPAREGADAGEWKFDVEGSLARKPDFVLTAGPDAAARFGEVMFALGGVDPRRDIGPAILASPTFLRLYRDHPVAIEPLLEHSAVYVRADSPERSKIETWRMNVSGF